MVQIIAMHTVLGILYLCMAYLMTVYFLCDASSLCEIG